MVLEAEHHNRHNDVIHNTIDDLLSISTIYQTSGSKHKQPCWFMFIFNEISQGYHSTCLHLNCWFQKYFYFFSRTPIPQNSFKIIEHFQLLELSSRQRQGSLPAWCLDCKARVAIWCFCENNKYSWSMAGNTPPQILHWRDFIGYSRYYSNVKVA